MQAKGEKECGPEMGPAGEHDACRVLFDLVISSVFVLAEDGSFLNVNQAACERLGFSRDELMQMRWEDVAFGKCRVTPAQLAHAFLEDESAFRDSQLLGKDGRIIAVELSIRGILQNGLRAYLMIARAPGGKDRAELQSEIDSLSARNALELRRTTTRLQLQMISRREAEHAYERSEKKFRTLYESMADAFVRVDMNGRVIEFNSAYRELLGYTDDELRGMSYEDFTPAKWHAMEAAMVRDQILPRGYSDVYEKEYRRKDGTIIPVELRAVVVRDEHGAPESMWAIARDITQRKDAEREKDRLASHFLQAQKLESLGALAGGIAHDFNNTLMAIVGNIDLTISSLPEDAPERENLVSAQEAAFRASDLCKQMLAYAGKGKFLVGPINLTALVREASVMLEASISKKISLKLELDEEAPMIHGDATQIRQILMNLAINAAEAIGDGCGTIAIRSGSKMCATADLVSSWVTETPRPGRYVYLEVQDTGCGIAPEISARIFDPFFSTKIIGRGLGLAAVLGIVTGHKGTISFSSEKGRGTLFRVYFPAIEATQLIGSLPRPSVEQWRGSGRVLLVDDDDTVRALGACMVELMGFSVVSAANGREAIERFTEDPDDYCLVILDLMMPEMDGRETFNAMQKINPSVPVIMSSGYTEVEISQRFNGCPIAAFLQKPYRRDALQQTVRDVIEKSVAK